MNQTGRITVAIPVLGASALILQATALREFMAVFAGNELDLGITLSIWLLAAGIGSITARGIESPRALGMTVLLTGPLAQTLLLCIPLLRSLLSLEPGEIIPLETTVLSTVALLAPVCFLVGMQFPLAVRSLAGKVSPVFLLEAAGACLGGMLFTLLLAGRVSAPVILTGVSMVYILAGALLLRSKGLALLLVVPLVVSYGLGRIRAEEPAENMVPVSRTESRYGTIEVFRLRDQFAVHAAGRFQFSYPDRQIDELRAHLPFSLHPRPRRVLLVGGAPGVARELLKYPDVAVDYVELDPELVRVALGLLTPKDRETLRDPRLTILNVDARRFIKNLGKPRYDMMILSGPEPSTANLNRLYTVEFFHQARCVLRDGGVIVLSVPASFGYVGKRMRTANSSIVASLASVFRHVALSSEEYGILAASDQAIETAPAVLRERFAQRAVSTDFFHQYILDYVFDPLKTAAHRARLDTTAALNTDARPVAYLYTLMVWAEMLRSGLLLSLADHGSIVVSTVTALAGLTGAFFWRRKRGAVYSAFIAGFSSMVLTVVILLAYQSAYGYVYERIGLLAAAFMAGSAGGAALLRNVARPKKALRLCEGAAIALLILTPWFFRYEVLYFVLAALGGGLGGAVFIAATKALTADDPAAAAGRLYAIDLAGSFLGALLTALILVPIFGIQTTVHLVVLLKGLSLMVLTSLHDEQA